MSGALLGRLAQATFNGESPASSLAFSADGQLLASGNSDGTIAIENLATDTTSTLNIGVSVGTIAFNPAGTTLAVFSYYPGGFIGKTEIVNLATGQTTTIDDPSDIAPAVAFSPDGATLAVGYINAPVLYDVKRKTSTTIKIPIGPESLAYSHNGKLLALGVYGNLTIYNTATGSTTTRLTGPRAQSVAFNPTDRNLAVGESNGKIILLDTATDAETSRPQ